MKRKTLPAIIFISLLLLIPLTCLWLSAFDLAWYQNEFGKLNVYQHFDKTGVLDQTQNLFGYLAGKNDLQKYYYTDREIFHLTDIKNIFAAAKAMTAALAIIFILTMLLSWHGRGLKKMATYLFWASGLCFACYLAKAVFWLFFFDQAFYFFHLVLFRNDFWQLDPAKESLIVIFPPPLFADLAKQIIANSLIVAGLLAIISFSYLKIKSK